MLRRSWAPERDHAYGLFSERFKHTHPAPDGAQARARQAEQRVHLRRSILITAAGMVDEDIIRLAELPRRAARYLDLVCIGVSSIHIMIPYRPTRHSAGSPICKGGRLCPPAERTEFLGNLRRIRKPLPIWLWGSIAPRYFRTSMLPPSARVLPSRRTSFSANRFVKPLRIAAETIISGVSRT